jgi:DNA-binding Lrp family transcriptional regulator
LLDDQQFKVLKTMSEATNRMDLNMFAKMVNLTPNETMQQVQELNREGFLQKVGSGFGITPKGKSALKAVSPVGEGLDFRFYYGVDRPTEVSVDTLQEFYMAIRQVSLESVEFHMCRGDFENWLLDVCKEPELAHEFGVLKNSSLRGEALRAEILKVLDEKYGNQNLL